MLFIVHEWSFIFDILHCHWWRWLRGGEGMSCRKVIFAITRFHTWIPASFIFDRPPFEECSFRWWWWQSEGGNRRRRIEEWAKTGGQAVVEASFIYFMIEVYQPPFSVELPFLPFSIIPQIPPFRGFEFIIKRSDHTSAAHSIIQSWSLFYDVAITPFPSITTIIDLMMMMMMMSWVIWMMRGKKREEEMEVIMNELRQLDLWRREEKQVFFRSDDFEWEPSLHYQLLVLIQLGAALIHPHLIYLHRDLHSFRSTDAKKIVA